MAKLAAAASEALSPQPAKASAGAPVTVTLDPAKKPVDLLTRKPIRPFTQADRGSIQFFLERLSEPLAYLTYFKEGTNTVPSDRLSRIVKTQEAWGIWRLYGRGPVDGIPLTQNVRTTAVSLIPLAADGAPASRVYLLLSDLNQIDWGNS
jgi:hypothetical protein